VTALRLFFRNREDAPSADDGAAGKQRLQILGVKIRECADVEEAMEDASENPSFLSESLKLRPIEE
jgi:hypothetical protein